MDLTPIPQATPFQTEIDNLISLPLDALIQQLAYLLPNLTPSISPSGDRLVTHPAHDGTGALDNLGRLYLNAAERCTREHASFQTRLLHMSLDAQMTKLYESSEEKLEKGVQDGSVTLQPPEYDGCACCCGEPSAVILCRFNDGDALYFWEEEYRKIWGEEAERGYQSGNGEVWLMASREQVERVMEREAGDIKVTRSSVL